MSNPRLERVVWNTLRALTKASPALDLLDALIAETDWTVERVMERLRSESFAWMDDYPQDYQQALSAIAPELRQALAEFGLEYDPDWDQD